ncbi:MAG: hypothetical protein JOZ43_08875 [Acidobacteriales bacterium]|nr:hypothetical protein [Terriglobales bacterium]
MRILKIGIAVAVLTACAAAQSNTQWVELVSRPVLKVNANGKGSALLRFTIKPEMHINSHKPSNQLLIPTVLSVPQTAGMKFTPLYPEGHDITLLGLEKVNVYSGTFDLRLDATAKDAPSHANVPVELKYQACNNSSCFPPKSLKFEVEVVR